MAVQIIYACRLTEQLLVYNSCIIAYLEHTW